MRSPELITRVIVEAALGAQGKSIYQRRNVVNSKSFLLQTKNLEGVPTEELGVIPAPTRTTGREIGLHQGCSGAGTVTDHATGMTVTAPGAVVNRSKHSMFGFVIPPCNSLQK